MLILRITQGKNITFFCLPEVFCDPEICHKCVLGPGSAPDPAGGAHDAPADPLVGWAGDSPPQTSPHSAPLALRSSPIWYSPLVLFAGLGLAIRACVKRSDIGWRCVARTRLYSGTRLSLTDAQLHDHWAKWPRTQQRRIAACNEANGRPPIDISRDKTAAWCPTSLKKHRIVREVESAAPS